MSFLKNYRKLKNNTGINISQKEDFINQACQNFEDYISNAPNSIQFEIHEKGVFDIGTVIDASDMMKKDDMDGKFLLTRPTCSLVMGDVVRFIDDGQYKDTYWMVRLLDNRAVNSHKKFNINEVNYFIKFKVNNNIFNIHCLSNNGSQYYMGQEFLDKIKYGNKVLNLTIGITQKGASSLFRGLRFLNKVANEWEAFEITSIIDTTPNMYTVTAIETQIIPEDDKINGLAFNKEFNNNGSNIVFKIVGEDKISFGTKNTYTIEPDLLSKSDITFEIDNPSFVNLEKINNKTCILKPLVKGEWINLKAKYGDIVVEKDIFIKK